MILTRISFSWMAYERVSTFISARTSSLEPKLKEKLALFSYFDAIARILGCFLHLTIDFWQIITIFLIWYIQFCNEMKIEKWYGFH